MTKAEDRTRNAHGQERQAPREDPADGRELDEEIVRDLELNEQAAEVRGGGCASSHQGVACQPE